MPHDSQMILDGLLARIASMETVRSIGVSGGEGSFPEAGEGDVDVFIYCNRIPDTGDRSSATGNEPDLEYRPNVFSGGHWGLGDCALIHGTEVWLMYFSIHETGNDVAAILAGHYPDKVDNYYYPVGRCAMLRDIRILYDKDRFLSSLKQTLSHYPEELADTLTTYHLQKLKDREDLTRAVLRRDVLFYHFALDLALDHFLQVLFAMNRTYFPSRKRTTTYIRSFSRLPERCEERLLEAVRLGSNLNTLEDSLYQWDLLVSELMSL